jgi:hypothetical protein
MLSTDRSSRDVNGSFKFSDSGITWLGNWSSSRFQPVKSRVLDRKRKGVRTVAIVPPENSVNRCNREVVSKRSEIGTVLMHDFVAQESRSKDCYIVNVPISVGLGLSFTFNDFDQVVVSAIEPFSDGKCSPAELCEIIKPGDQLIKVNESFLEALDYDIVSDVVNNLDGIGQVAFLNGSIGGSVYVIFGGAAV